MKQNKCQGVASLGPHVGPINRHIYETYMVTVNVSPKKFINYTKQWGQFNNVEQELMLLKAYNAITSNDKIFNREHRFELTTDGHKHLHFVCSTTLDVIEDVQRQFHKKFGMPKLEPKICCTYSVTVKSRVHAIEYICKEDDPNDPDYVPERCLFIK